MTPLPPAARASDAASGGRLGRPLRVLYANHVGTISGGENSMLALVRHLDRRRFAPLAAVPAGPLAQELQRQGVRVHVLRELRLGRPHSLFAGAWAALRLRAWAMSLHRAARALECDLVDANSLIAGLGAQLAVGRRLAVVWHARDLRAPRGAERWLAHRVTRIAAISGCVADHLFRVTGSARERTVLIYNGIEPDGLQPARSADQVRRELGLPEDCPLVGTVGQVIPWKRQEVFIEAAARVLARVPRCRFLVVGADLFGEHPDWARQLRSLATTLNISDRVIFTGYREDAISVIASLDVLVHPAEDEPLGRVLLEAMSLGVPCVAAASAGPAEIIQDGVTGLLVTPGDVDGFAREVLDLLARPAAARRLAQAARARIERDFSAARMARLTEDLYAEALAERSLA
jgi:glycosyltransferase involved in cell wall biosynthesis